MLPPADPRLCHPRQKIGILAYGSLIADPGKLSPLITKRIGTETPFNVEYGRISETRGGAPTLVPHERGARVKAQILILAENVPFDRARNLLWLRERRKEDSGETYVEGNGPNDVLVREWKECPWVDTVLYTDFNATGKKALNAEELARHAISSVAKAKPGMDGITYLQNAENAGIKTPLTATYQAQILKHTDTQSLQKALKKAKSL